MPCPHTEYTTLTSVHPSDLSDPTGATTMGVGYAKFPAGSASSQGLTLVHHSAQLEPFLTQKHTLCTPSAPDPPLNTPETTSNCNPCHTEGA